MGGKQERLKCDTCVLSRTREILKTDGRFSVFEKGLRGWLFLGALFEVGLPEQMMESCGVFKGSQQRLKYSRVNLLMSLSLRPSSFSLEDQQQRLLAAQREWAAGAQKREQKS